mgnify:CR=1 FL=1
MLFRSPLDNHQRVWPPCRCKVRSTRTRLNLQELIRSSEPVDVIDASTDHRLKLAWAWGHVACCRLLLDAGASPEFAADDATATTTACGYGRTECLRVLIEGGADLDHRDPSGECALTTATWSAECVKILLAAGASVDRGNPDGFTALLGACFLGETVSAQLLCSFGADRLKSPWEEVSAIELARAQGYDALANWMDASDGWSPLHHLEALDSERTRALLRGGASPWAFGGEPVVTPLERAREQPASEVARLIRAAAEPWSPATHDLFPRRPRSEAVELMRIGYLLAWSPRFQGQSRSLIDAWVYRPEGGSVLECAVTRFEELD